MPITHTNRSKPYLVVNGGLELRENGGENCTLSGVTSLKSLRTRTVQHVQLTHHRGPDVRRCGGNSSF